MTDSRPRRPSARWIAAGAVVWALHFTLIYGFTGVACARGQGAWVPAAVGIATAIAAATAIGLALWGVRTRTSFSGWLLAAVAGMALIAILWESLPALMVAPCGLR